MTLAESESTPGERVVMIPLTFCGKYYFCLRGLPAYCERAKFYGLTRNGFFAEYTALRTKNLISIPENVSDEEAAIVEPVALALRVLDLH